MESKMKSEIPPTQAKFARGSNKPTSGGDGDLSTSFKMGQEEGIAQ